MRLNRKRAAALFLALTMTAALSACAAPAPTPSGVPQTDAPVPSGGPQAVVLSGHARGGWGRDDVKYSKADYDLALSFQTEGYADLSVAAFDRSVMDWDDEDAYHRTEAALDRLCASLPGDDPNAGFIFGTLSTAWNACEKRHYSTCERERNPWHSGWASCETYGDVFGDQVLLYGGYVDFCFDYQVPDEQRLTVGQRDTILQSVEDGMEAYLARQTTQALQDEAAMEKSLKAELNRLLAGLQGGIVWGGTSSLGYYWDQVYGYGAYGATAVGQESGTDDPWPDTYTKAQYDLVLDRLWFDAYQTLSVAEFNRGVNAAFSDYDGGWQDSLSFAYEVLMMYLPESDPAYAFLHDTVPAALDEYNTRAEEVCSGKQIDFQRSCYASASREADVYGDKIVVGMAEADYTITYRIPDAGALTVQARDAFLNSVMQGAQDYLSGAAASDPLDKTAFQAAVERAGKAASGEAIVFTGCTVHYLEVYN